MTASLPPPKRRALRWVARVVVLGLVTLLAIGYLEPDAGHPEQFAAAIAAGLLAAAAMETAYVLLSRPPGKAAWWVLRAAAVALIVTWVVTYLEIASPVAVGAAAVAATAGLLLAEAAARQVLTPRRGSGPPRHSP